MFNAVIFDLFETLITEWVCEKYTSHKCAADLGIDAALFREVWKSLQEPRYTGGCTYEQAIRIICHRAGESPTPDKLEYILSRRRDTKKTCFQYWHEDIIQMLGELKAGGYKFGLISNCSQEEVEAFHDSALSEYFDAAVLSCEVGLVKPDPEIFILCAKRLGVTPSDCLYIGDSSYELYGARDVGMTPIRAIWFLNRYEKAVEQIPFEEAADPEVIVKNAVYKTL